MRVMSDLLCALNPGVGVSATAGNVAAVDSPNPHQDSSLPLEWLNAGPLACLGLEICGLVIGECLKRDAAAQGGVESDPSAGDRHVVDGSGPR